MQSFTDSEGRTWTLNLTLGSAERVRALVGVDLLAPCEPPPEEAPDPDALPVLTRLGTDLALLCDVIFALIKPEADGRGVTDEQWAGAMGGEAILGAQTAFYEELVCFFRSLGRPDVVRAARTQHRMIELVVRAGEERLEAIDPEAEVARILETSPPERPRPKGPATCGGSDMNSARSPGSTPESSH